MKTDSRIVLVMGGSRGIGFAIAEAFVQRGYKVLISARNKAELLQAQSMLASMYNQDVYAATCQAHDNNSCIELVEQTISSLGEIDILVNAAGVQGPIGELIDLDLEEWKHAFEILFYGPLHLTNAILPRMIKRGEGKVINISGGGAVKSRPNFSSYASAKAALLRFTETVAEEVKKYGIQVNAIAPGAIYTRMTEQVISMGANAGSNEYQSALEVKATGGASLERVKQLALFLASEESNNVTGQLISAVHHDWWCTQREGAD